MSRTQLRLQQVTGSFGIGSGQINDQIITAASATGSIDSSDLASVLSHLAASIKKIHGADSFTEAAAGEFSQSIVPDSVGGQDIGSTSVEWGDIFIADGKALQLGNDQDVTITHDSGTGADVVSAGAFDIQAGATSVINTTAGNLTVDSNAGNLVLDGHTGVDIDASNSGKVSIDGAGGIDIGVAADVAIDINSSTLDIDASGAVTIDASAGSISIGTNSSGRAINIGHTTSEVTVNDNLTVTGDLTVNGDTITVNVENMTVEDNIIGLATTGSTAYGPSGNDRGVVFAGGALADKQPALYYDGSASKFVFATTATSPSSASFVATPAQGELDTVVASTISFDFAGNETISGDGTDISFAVGANGDINIPANIGLTFGNDGEIIEGDGTDLTIKGGDINLTAEADVNIPQDIGLTFGADTQKIEANASNDLTIEAGGDIYLDANGADIVFMDGGTTFGKITNSSSDLVLSASIGGQALKLEGSGDGVYIRDLESDMFKVIHNSISQANEIQFATGQSAIIKSQGGTDIVIAANDLGTVVLGLDDSAGTGYLMVTGSGADATIAIGGLQGGFGSAGGALTLTGSRIEFKGGASAFESRYYNIGETNYVGFKAPSSPDDTVYQLPAADGTNGYALTTNGSGVLSWADPAGASLRRTIVKATQTIAAGNIDLGSSKTAGLTTLLTSDNLDLSGISDADLVNKVEVYVNGALLVSGSDGDADADYTHIDDDTLKFAFSLEADDIIQVITR